MSTYDGILKHHERTLGTLFPANSSNNPLVLQGGSVIGRLVKELLPPCGYIIVAPPGHGYYIIVIPWLVVTLALPTYDWGLHHGGNTKSSWWADRPGLQQAVSFEHSASSCGSVSVGALIVILTLALRFCS